MTATDQTQQPTYTARRLADDHDLRIHVVTRHGIARDAEGWEHHLHKCQVTSGSLSNGTVVKFDWRSGVGHRGSAPSLFEVIEDAAMNARILEDCDTVGEFARELGYTDDVDKALATYKSCQEHTAKWRKLLGADGFANLLLVEEQG